MRTNKNHEPVLLSNQVTLVWHAAMHKLSHHSRLLFVFVLTKEAFDQEPTRLNHQRGICLMNEANHSRNRFRKGRDSHIRGSMQLV